MSLAMGELAVRVDGKTLFSYKQAGEKLPSDAELLKLITP